MRILRRRRRLERGCVRVGCGRRRGRFRRFFLLLLLSWFVGGRWRFFRGLRGGPFELVELDLDLEAAVVLDADFARVRCEES